MNAAAAPILSERSITCEGGCDRDMGRAFEATWRERGETRVRLVCIEDLAILVSRPDVSEVRIVRLVDAEEIPWP